MPTFEDYVGALRQLSSHHDPTAVTPENIEIRAVVERLMAMPTIDTTTLAAFVHELPHAVPVLGLVVGLTREKLRNILRHRLGTPSWRKLARERPSDLVAILAADYALVKLLDEQLHRSYDFADIVIARSATRRAAAAASATGRAVEDAIEAVAAKLGLPYAARTRFEGRNGSTAPCDLAIPTGGRAALIVVAAKGFDSTGSKLTDAVREVEEMAEKRLPTQFVMAAVDGIGWKNRLNDLRRIYALRESNRIDGLYTLSDLHALEHDLEHAARRLGLLSP